MSSSTSSSAPSSPEQSSKAGGKPLNKARSTRKGGRKGGGGINRKWRQCISSSAYYEEMQAKDDVRADAATERANDLYDALYALVEAEANREATLEHPFDA